MHFLTECLVIASMLAINAVFASYEMALAVVSRSRIEACRQAGRKGARSAHYMKERMEGSLAVVQLGITLAGAGGASLGAIQEALGTSIIPPDQKNLSLAEYAERTLAKPKIACGDLLRLGPAEILVRKLRRGRVLEAVVRLSGSA